MIPSDHFVRFYNETFKFLAEHSEDALRNFWLAISDLQESLVGELFREKGFYGMKEYYDRIIEEENLKAECFADDEHFEFRMYECASLRKAKDNDAGQMPRYCDHCPGWINPLMKRLGYYPVFDIENRCEPHCHLIIFRDKNAADKAAEKGEIVFC